MYKYLNYCFKMQTRNGTKYETPLPNAECATLIPVPLNVEIDFDAASTAWKLNKKLIGNGCYKYICVKIKKTGNQCKNDSLKNCEYCKFHSTFSTFKKG